MSLPVSPFARPTVKAGHGRIILSLLPPGKLALTAFEYQYPLKLIAPDPHNSPSGHPVALVFLLTYGGGLVAGDQINLDVDVAERARLALVTQGSTKVFKSSSKDVISGQRLEIKVRKHAALVYLPDPVQPFSESCYQQAQTFRVEASGESSLCVLDWLSEGRPARGEKWNFWLWRGRNEVRELVKDGVEGCKEGKLLLRDALILNDETTSQVHGLVDKTTDMGVFGTLIIYGKIFDALKEHFMQEFAALPRIGAKQWTTNDITRSLPKPPKQSWREDRIGQEKAAGLIWTAASVRGFVLVKFASKDVEGSRRWLAAMLAEEGSVRTNFGPQALMCFQ